MKYIKRFCRWVLRQELGEMRQENKFLRSILAYELVLFDSQVDDMIDSNR